MLIICMWLACPACFFIILRKWFCDLFIFLDDWCCLVGHFAKIMCRCFSSDSLNPKYLISNNFVSEDHAPVLLSSYLKKYMQRIFFQLHHMSLDIVWHQHWNRDVNWIICTALAKVQNHFKHRPSWHVDPRPAAARVSLGQRSAFLKLTIGLSSIFFSLILQNFWFVEKQEHVPIVCFVVYLVRETGFYSSCKI